jgi:D-alanyl-D-alanine carboxypeptidase (penicillin-binding protein 5/6)
MLLIYYTTNFLCIAMNTLVTKYGCSQTYFKNCHGMDQEGHFSSACDIALIAAIAMQNPFFRSVVNTKEYTLCIENQNLREQREVVWRNTNKMLFLSRRATSRTYDGVKTGESL